MVIFVLLKTFVLNGHCRKDACFFVHFVIISVCLERQWNEPEMSVRCGAASTVTVKPNSGKAVFVTVAVRCYTVAAQLVHGVGCEDAEAALDLCHSLLSCHCCSLLTPVRTMWRQLLRSAAAASQESGLISADFMSLRQNTRQHTCTYR